jgi:cysteinyl-tRNA synthetase
MDFALWKSAKPDEPNWPSPWGAGRPGWHIECSAMGSDLLGKHFDIHGGGQDLQFPHHENEIAQSEGAHGCKFVNYWLHNGFVRVDDEKMSKSLGNFFTIREVLEKYKPETVRFFILRAHYRSPLNYSDKHLDDANAALNRLYKALQGIEVGTVSIDWGDARAERFKRAMDDDFNTPEAMAVLFELANELNKTRDQALAALLKGLGGLLGLLQRTPDEHFKVLTYSKGAVSANVSGQLTSILGDSTIEELIAKRLDARKAKDFKRSDAIRDELKSVGIVLEDGPQGTLWRRE